MPTHFVSSSFRLIVTGMLSSGNKVVHCLLSSVKEDRRKYVAVEKMNRKIKDRKKGTGFQEGKV